MKEDEVIYCGFCRGSGVNPDGPADTDCTNCGGTGLIKEKERDGTKE